MLEVQVENLEAKRIELEDALGNNHIFNSHSLSFIDKIYFYFRYSNCCILFFFK